MKRRTFLLGCGGGMLLAPLAARAATPEYGIVGPRTCLAGRWGDPHPEHRVQLALFQDYEAAERHVERLGKAGLAARQYIALWLAVGDEEPQVVTLDSAFPSAAAARRRASQLRRSGVDAFARAFVHYY